MPPVNSCPPRAWPMQAEVEIHPPLPILPPVAQHGQQPPSGTVLVSEMLRKCPKLHRGEIVQQQSRVQRLEKQGTGCSGALGLVCLPPSAQSFPWFSWGLFLVSETRCGGATVSPQVPACLPAAGVALWLLQERQKRSVFGPFPGKKGLCFVPHSFCRLVKHGADMPRRSSGVGTAPQGLCPSCATAAEHHQHRWPAPCRG